MALYLLVCEPRSALRTGYGLAVMAEVATRVCGPADACVHGMKFVSWGLRRGGAASGLTRGGGGMSQRKAAALCGLRH